MEDDRKVGGKKLEKMKEKLIRRIQQQHGVISEQYIFAYLHYKGGPPLYGRQQSNLQQNLM